LEKLLHEEFVRGCGKGRGNECVETGVDGSSWEIGKMFDA